MAANKFATMLHRNTHKSTVILVYAVLEWVLILLLLMNSLFSFLIAKFADYFGLKPPCLWCSRVDHILEPNKNPNPYRELVCESHANEISKLSYCPNHRKLAESQNLCENCFYTHPRNNEISTEISPKIGFVTWVNENRNENAEKSSSRCSCCDESLSSKVYPSYLLFKPNWGVLDYIQKGTSIIETVNEDNSGCEYSDTWKSDSQTDPYDNDQNTHQREEEEEEEENRKCAEDEDQILSDVESFSFEAALEDCLRSVMTFENVLNEANLHEEANPETQEHGDFVQEMVQRGCGEDESLTPMNLTPEDNHCRGFEQLMPVELIESSTSERSYKHTEEDLVGRHEHIHGNFVSESQAETQVERVEEAAPDTMSGSTDKSYGVKESLGTDEIENSSILVDEQRIQDIERCEQPVITEAAAMEDARRCTTVTANNLPEGEEEDGWKLLGDETKSEIMNGNEVSGYEPPNPTLAKEPTPSLSCLKQEKFSMDSEFVGFSICLDSSMTDNHQGLKQIEKSTLQETTVLDGNNREWIDHHSYNHSLTNDEEEDKFPDRPTYMDGLHHPDRKLLPSEKREQGTEESWDGSVASEMDGNDGAATVEQLKSTLTAERKALTALYSELEEERNAAAIAANQTMAMITRLQEEKAAMQMEALQYQRMMEEQSEYDQEALQLLNELMVKREKEKQELEKEVEFYRMKALDYEAKEKMVTVRTRHSSASCSNAEDRDDLAFDLNTPTDVDLNVEEMGLDCVKHLSTLDESLAEFEEERVLILEELKALEEKLFTLGDDDEEQMFEDVKPIEHFGDDYGREFPENYAYEFSSPEENVISNALCGVLNGKQFSENKIMGLKAKRLLPLFEATGVEDKEEELNEEQSEFDSVRMENSFVYEYESEKKKIAIEEEVDHLYERLQALEADREFLKHCISSLKKGDKGMGLLQEILQHLRDLRTVELHARSMSESPPS